MKKTHTNGGRRNDGTEIVDSGYPHSHTHSRDPYYGYYGPTTVSGITVLPVYSTEAVIVGPPSLEDAHTGSTMIQSCRSLFEQGAGGSGGGA